MSYDKVGDVLVAQGNLPEALKSFRRARDQRPSGEGRPRQRRLAARPVGVVREGRRRAGGAGRSAGRAEILPAGLAIRDRLAKADPGNAGWQRDLSLSYEKVGDVQVAQGNLPEALKSFRDGLAIFDRLAKADPGNAGWQRNLSVSYNKIGDVLVAQGNLPEALKSYRDCLAIRDRLAKADPGNAGWQRDLSVSYDRVGDVLMAQGNLPEALASYQASLAIADRLAKSDPGNAGWQRDLSVSYEKVGDVQVAQGNLPDALESYRRASPLETGWRRPIPATPAGSAICRCRTTRSATCRWRRAICRTR